MRRNIDPSPLYSCFTIQPFSYLNFIRFIQKQIIVEMFIRTIVHLVFFGLILDVSSDSFLGNRVKRSDIDLQTCIDNFNVHRDKIIRTQDSQNMGAKYLNEIDLGSREECLRLCCETDDCDVFVFEEKNSGSCYLFHCGPPEDFKCKFTHHVNYSSAVLSINRHLPDLESQIKLTKHEQDLTKLRKPEVENEDLRQIVPETKTTPLTTTTSTASKEVIPVNKIKEPVEARKCSRFQFECRSTGECIAIYNACDGIPQCADGSDEAPELGCPDSATTALPPPVIVNNPATPIRYDANMQQPSISQMNPNSPSQYRPPIPRGPPQLPPVVPHNDADFIRPVNDLRNVVPQYDPQPGPQQMQPYVQQLSVQGQSNWVPHQSNQMPVQVPQYADKNSHIFNHKETGLQVPDGQEIRYNKYKGAMQYLHRALGYSGGGGQLQYPDTMNGRDYPKVPIYYGDSYRQPIQQENWPPAEDVRYSDVQRYPPETIPVPVLDQTSKDQNIYKSTAIQAIKPRTATVNPKHIQEKLAHDLKHSKDNMEHGNADHEKKIKIEKHPHHEEYPDVVEYKISDSSDLQDGFAHAPRGAVLSVTLGLIITFVMAIMIGCRLKMVRRRVKRGKSYAHDADYLVNGMYL